jgi:hypothetical protein
MPPLSASIEVVGDKAAVAELIKTGTRGTDIAPIAPLVRAVYLKSNKKHLDEGGSGGADWPPLAEATIAQKAALGLPERPEYRTGRLYASLTSETRVRGQTNRVAKTRMRFGSRLPYAHLQEGTKHQPARDLIDLTVTDREAMATIIGRYVAHGLEGVAEVVTIA